MNYTFSFLIAKPYSKIHEGVHYFPILMKNLLFSHFHWAEYMFFLSNMKASQISSWMGRGLHGTQIFLKRRWPRSTEAQAHLERHLKYQCIHVHNLMTIYIGRNQVEIRSLTTLVCFMTIWCKAISGFEPFQAK